MTFPEASRLQKRFVLFKIMANRQHELFLVCCVVIASSCCVTIFACDIELSKHFVCGHGKLQKLPALRFSFSDLPMKIFVVSCIFVGRNLWICDIHGSAYAICGSIVFAEIHGMMDVNITFWTKKL